MTAKILNIRHTRGHRDFRETHVNPCHSANSLAVTSATTRTEITIPEDRNGKVLRNLRKNIILYIIRTHEITP